MEDIGGVVDRIQKGDPDQGKDDVEHDENAGERRCGEDVRHGGWGLRRGRKGRVAVEGCAEEEVVNSNLGDAQGQRPYSAP